MADLLDLLEADIVRYSLDSVLYQLIRTAATEGPASALIWPLQLEPVHFSILQVPAASAALIELELAGLFRVADRPPSAPSLFAQNPWLPVRQN